MEALKATTQKQYSKTDQALIEAIQKNTAEYFDLLFSAEQSFQSKDLDAPDIVAELLYNSKDRSGMFDAIETSYECMKPPEDEKYLSVRGAFYFVKDSFLLDYINKVESIELFIRNNEPQKTDYGWVHVFKAVQELKDFAYGELYERLQYYKNEPTEAS